MKKHTNNTPASTCKFLKVTPHIDKLNDKKKSLFLAIHEAFTLLFKPSSPVRTLPIKLFALYARTMRTAGFEACIEFEPIELPETTVLTLARYKANDLLFIDEEPYCTIGESTGKTILSFYVNRKNFTDQAKGIKDIVKN